MSITIKRIATKENKVVSISVRELKYTPSSRDWLLLKAIEPKNDMTPQTPYAPIQLSMT